MAKEITFDMVTTRGGDSGKSSLYTGEFIPKSDDVFDVLGELDMLSSQLGWGTPAALRETKEHIQTDLQMIMAIIASSAESPKYPVYDLETQVPVLYLERLMKRLMSKTKIEPKFVLPRGRFDVIRAQARTAERTLVKYIRTEFKTIPVEYPDLYHCQKYLNRLSDLLFVLARWVESKE